jgi:hypothetical protein
MWMETGNFIFCSLSFPAFLFADSFSLGVMRILSGIQPSGALHLGNYFGMMRPAIELQEKGEALYFIADYHSMTSLFDADERRKNTLGCRPGFPRVRT